MKRSKFESLIDQAPEIPTLPAVATQILNVVRDPGSGARDVRRIVELDPVLSARVMQWANSAYFGLPNEVTDLRQAIALLGFNSIRNLAFAACIKSLYGSEYRCGTFTAGGLWLHSVSVAVIARMLADRAWPELREETFLAGIIHDVGIIVEWNLLPERFAQVIRSSEGTGQPFLEAEKRALGFNHCSCGAAMLRRWRLPKHLIRVARYHHGHKKGPRHPDAVGVHLGDRLAALIHLAECVCGERGNGFFDEPRNDELTGTLLTVVGCDWGDYRQIVDATDAELDRARDILSL